MPRIAPETASKACCAIVLSADWVYKYARPGAILIKMLQVVENHFETCYNEGVEGAGRFLLPVKQPLLVERPRPSTRLRQTTDSGLLIGDDMTCGIYKITNLKTGEFYIGKSVHISARKSHHLRDLKLERHSSSGLQNAYNKFGSRYLRFEIVVICEKFELSYYEKELIKGLSPEYNTALTGRPRCRKYIEPIFVNGKEEIAGLEKNWRPKPWHKWVYGGHKNPK